MRNIPFDTRWLYLVFLLLILLRPDGLVGVVLLAIGAGWVLQAGWNMLQPVGRGTSTTKVTYWRGQRIETRQSPTQRMRAVPIVQLVIGAFYLVLGVGMAYAAIILFARFSGLL